MKLKIVVTVPFENAASVRMAIGKAGGGTMGNYSYCSFTIVGTGRFLPGEDANPHIGRAGTMESVPEERIEISCDKNNVKEIVEAIRTSHPYEEPAIDIYTLLDENSL